MLLLRDDGDEAETGSKTRRGDVEPAFKRFKHGAAVAALAPTLTLRVTRSGEPVGTVHAAVGSVHAAVPNAVKFMSCSRRSPTSVTACAAAASTDHSRPH